MTELTFIISLLSLLIRSVLLRGLQRRARSCGPTGLLASPERPGPSEPNIPLPPLSGLGRPKCQEQPQEGVALQRRQRRGAELRDQPLHQSVDRRLFCESSADSGPNVEKMIKQFVFYKITKISSNLTNLHLKSVQTRAETINRINYKSIIKIIVN